MSKFVPVQQKFSFYEQVYLYDTAENFYLVGSNELRTAHQIITIKRLIDHPDSLSQIIEVDPKVYEEDDINNWIDSLNVKYMDFGGVTLTCVGYGITGFVKFLDCYYLTIITEVKKVGNLYGNWIYTIKSTEIIPLKKRDAIGDTVLAQMMYKINKKVEKIRPDQDTIDETRYLGLFKLVDCTKDFFLSYTYDLTHTFQHNYVKSLRKEDDKNDLIRKELVGMFSFETLYMWNYWQLEEFNKILIRSDSHISWVMPIVHGGYQQRRLDCALGYLDLTVFARRSRIYAGTRYLKRGVSVHGDVANEVEVETIIQWDHFGRKKSASMVQV